MKVEKIKLPVKNYNSKIQLLKTNHFCLLLLHKENLYNRCESVDTICSSCCFRIVSFIDCALLFEKLYKLGSTKPPTVEPSKVS
jgi:hypothetical protein